MQTNDLAKRVKELRDQLERGEITREQFLELREPIKAEMAKRMFQ